MQTSAGHICLDGWPGSFPAGSTFCCSCGDQLAKCRLSPEVLTVAIPASGEVQRGSLLLDATGSLFDVRMELHFDAQRLSVDDRGESPVVVDVPAGEQRNVLVGLGPGKRISGNNQQDEISAFLNGSKSIAQKIAVRIGSVPRIEASSLEFTDAVAGLAARAEGSLRHLGGLDVRIEDFHFEPAFPGLRVVGLTTGQSLQSSREAKFFVEAAKLPPGGIISALILRFDAVPPIRIDVEIHPRDARVSWGARKELFVGIDAELKVFVRPVGNKPVRIQKMELVNPPSWLNGQSLSFPITVTDEKAFEWKLRVDGSNPSLQLGIAKLEVKVTLEKLGERSGGTVLQIKEPEFFPEWVGVDFGTTNSCVAYWSHGEKPVRMVDFARGEGKTTVPSVAYFDEDKGEWLGGLEAMDLAEKHGRRNRLVHSIKRVLNQPLNSEKRGIWMDDGNFVPPEAAATAILRFLVRRTEEALQQKIENVILTHPANFSDTGIRALVDCAAKAGIQLSPSNSREEERRRRLDEPVAVAFQATQFQTEKLPEGQLVLVFDFGGGTLDVSLLEIVDRTDERRMHVLAHKGANWLGGDDFTRRLVHLAAGRIQADTAIAFHYDVDALSDSDAWIEMDTEQQMEVYRNWRILWDQAEQAKVRLSADKSAFMSGTFSHCGASTPFSIEVTAEEFDHAVADLVERSMDFVRMTMDCVDTTRKVYLDNLDLVIASGKTSLIPSVRRRLKDLCKKDLMALDGFDVKECVAQGACSRGHELATPLGLNTARREIYGLDERINCSYGVVEQAGSGAGTEDYFHPLIPEGISKEASQAVVTHTVVAQGVARQTISVYQHTGNARTLEGCRLRGNSDIAHLADIKVKMPVTNLFGKIEVRMWVGKDGLLQVEAAVEGSEERFRPRGFPSVPRPELSVTR